jgi:hypothetical protein
VDTRDLVREALYGFFRRYAEAGKFYCAPCLVKRLRRTFPPAAVQAAVADAFERPRSLRVKPRGPCEACKKLRPSVVALRARLEPGPGTPP